MPRRQMSGQRGWKIMLGERENKKGEFLADKRSSHYAVSSLRDQRPYAPAANGLFRTALDFMKTSAGDRGEASTEKREFVLHPWQISTSHLLFRIMGAKQIGRHLGQGGRHRACHCVRVLSLLDMQQMRKYISLTRLREWGFKEMVITALTSVPR